MLGALLAAAVVAAQPAPPPPQAKAHAIMLTDQDLETIRFMTIAVGSRCTATDEGYQYCRAALLARELAIAMQAQLAAEGKKP